MKMMCKKNVYGKVGKETIKTEQSLTLLKLM